MLVPVSGDFWHDSLEVCANRSRFYGGGFNQWCWNDLLVVRRCDPCLKHVLFNSLLPLTRAGPPQVPAAFGVSAAKATHLRSRFVPPFAGVCDCL